jgi:hypothetical protein
MAAQKSIYELLVLESNDQSRTVDISQGAVSLDYYEDIFSPTITAKLKVVNVGNTITPPKGSKDKQTIYNGLPLRGGERLVLKIAPNSRSVKSSLDFSTPERYLYVSSISDVIMDATKESFTLNIVSREAITNETIRVVKKYPSNQRIDQSVDSILKEYLIANKINKIDKTSNPYGFIGNLRKPFTILIWLASKSVPDAKDSNAGFVFYQTKQGFNFRSLDGLITQQKKATYVYTHTGESYVGLEKINNDYNILNYYVDRNQNLLEKLRLGAYASQRMFFNPATFNVTSPEDGQYTFEDYKNTVKTLGSKLKLPKVSDGSNKTLGDIPSRIFTQILDIGTTDQEVTKDLNSDPEKYQSQSLMRYNLLLTQTINIMVPCNLDLNAGDSIECLFPKITENTQNQEYDSEISGLYIIKELCHHFDTENSYTSLKLIRDTFGRQNL